MPFYLVVTLQRSPCMSCGWRLNRPRVTVTAVFVVNHNNNNSFQFNSMNPRCLELGENGVLTVEWNPEILPSFVAVHAVAGVDG